MSRIPSTNAEAFKRLDRHLTKQERLDLSRCTDLDLIDYHFGLGMWIRNTWKCDDDESSAIIKDYRNYLRKKK